MKEIKMFMFAGCPHCMKAKEIIDDLFKSETKYSKVPLSIIDEKLQPEVADKYNYFLVPTFFVGEVKMHEGPPTKELIISVFNKACEE